MPTDRDDVRAALAAIDRERYKAIAVTAVADAVVALLVVAFALRVLDLPPVPDTVGPVSTATVGGVLAGVVVLAAALIVHRRRITVERFEATNPTLDAAVRTARDVLDRDGDDTMSRLLYRDLVDRLSAASSQELLNTRLLGARLVVVFLLSVAALHVTVAGITVAPLPADATGADGDPATVGSGDPNQGPPRDQGLQDGDQVLGERKEVTNGSDPLESNVSGSGGGEGPNPGDYDRQGLTAGDEIETQRGGFDAPGEEADADLIREYTLRVTRNDTE